MYYITVPHAVTRSRGHTVCGTTRYHGPHTSTVGTDSPTVKQHVSFLATDTLRSNLGP